MVRCREEQYSASTLEHGLPALVIRRIRCFAEYLFREQATQAVPNEEDGPLTESGVGHEVEDLKASLWQ